jgi:membrane protein
MRGFVQLSVIIAEGFVRDQLLLRANALTFLSLLALVPLVAVAVSISSALGMSAENMTQRILEQVAAGSPAAVEKILPLVENLNFAALGASERWSSSSPPCSRSETSKGLNQIWGLKRQRSGSAGFHTWRC